MNSVKKNIFKIELFLIFPVAILSKILQFNFLPQKYFYDSGKILYLMKENLQFTFSDSYSNTAIFSNWINIFNLSTLFEWSVFYAVIFNVVIYIILSKYNITKLYDYIFIYATIGLLNIYIFNLSKDIFQFMIFLLLYIICVSNIKDNYKFILCFSVMFTWGIIYRIYYVLIALYFLIVYVTINFPFKSTKKRIIPFVLICIFLSFLLFMYFMPNEYNSIVNARSGVNIYRQDSTDAETIINDIIPIQDNVFVFTLNYILNLIRLLFPFELLLKLEFQYYIFVIYQLMVTNYVLKKLKQIVIDKDSNEKNITFCIMCGFILGSTLFEPDFGSWVRHESTVIFILLNLFLKKFNIKNTLRYK